MPRECILNVNNVRNVRTGGNATDGSDIGSAFEVGGVIISINVFTVSNVHNDRSIVTVRTVHTVGRLSY
jgi:hypothetical protein